MSNNTKGMTILGDRKIMFTMAFVEYVSTKDFMRPKARFKQIRQAEGFLLNNDVLLDQETTSEIKKTTPHLSCGVIIQFKADIALNNLEFNSPLLELGVLKSDKKQIDRGGYGQ